MNNRLVESPSFVWLVPVRGAGPAIHFVYRDKGQPSRGPSLCGQEGTLDRYGVPRFRAVFGRSGNVCNACHAQACREPTRVEWKA